MTKDHVGFIVGRKGIVFMLREDGRRQKCGFRIRDDHIEVFDRRTSTWHVLPEQLISRDGQVINVVVLTE